MNKHKFLAAVMALTVGSMFVPNGPSTYALDDTKAAAKEVTMPKIKVGDMAPDFTMPDQNGKPVSLHDFRGKKNVALAFYVFAFTGG